MINADPALYGSFAEIGAGQEVARWFFRAGKASATVAKTMSAYDMIFSDAIYGAEKNKRYVCESRLTKMLTKEFDLLQERLNETRGSDTRFFVFADTLASKSRRTKGGVEESQGGHGWIGVRFQDKPGAPFNEVYLHARMLDASSLDQQEAVGILGVNLLYACFFLSHDPIAMIRSLSDQLKEGRVEVDTIRFRGHLFSDVDNRLMSMQLVQFGLTAAVLLDPSGEIVQPSEALYKKDVLVLRGRFRPLTRTHMDMLESGKQDVFRAQKRSTKDVVPVLELTLRSLDREGSLEIEDFHERVNVLATLGYHVLVSRFVEYREVADYFSKQTSGRIDLLMGIGHLNRLFDETIHEDAQVNLLGALGQLFLPRVTALVYPAFSLSVMHPQGETPSKSAGQTLSLSNYEAPKSIQPLFSFLRTKGYLREVFPIDDAVLKISGESVLDKIRRKDKSWMKDVPSEVVDLIAKYASAL